MLSSGQDSVPAVWPLLTENAAVQDALIAAARDRAPASGLPHNFYRYSARFSPQFVRSAMEAFTVPSALAAGSFPSSAGPKSSGSSPVAIFITLTALLMTSAGRRSPLESICDHIVL